MSNLIRRVVVFKNFIEKLPSGQVIEKAMAYNVGSEMNIDIDGEQVKKKIYKIDETAKYLLVYLISNGEYQLWKKLPKNDMTSIEYVID